jgi:hypothetical protein
MGARHPSSADVSESDCHNWRFAMLKVSASVIALLAATPAFAVGPNCGDQLAQIKSQLTSEQLAQSAEAKQYQQAERLCSAGKDMEAQDMARQIREQMAQKGTAGSSGAPTSAGSSVGGASGQSK